MNNNGVWRIVIPWSLAAGLFGMVITLFLFIHNQPPIITEDKLEKIISRESGLIRQTVNGNSSAIDELKVVLNELNSSLYALSELKYRVEQLEQKTDRNSSAIDTIARKLR